MNMIQVDTKLFITCRLCLNEFGTYQIVPSVQEEIKFCFDIDVQPFDGLPQLICKKCVEILKDFHTKKKMFQGKHAALLEKVKGHTSKASIDLETILDQQDPNKEVEEAVSSSQIIKENFKFIVRNESRRSRKKVLRKRRPKHKSPIWWQKAGFSKNYQCRLCNKSFIIKPSIINHMRCHKTLIQNLKKSNIRYCNVRIEKFDGKPNKTGSSKTVVLDDHRVLQNIYNTYYYIKFSAIQQTTDDNENESNSDDDIYFKGNKKKRRRIISQDSTDTVILDNDLIKENDSIKELVDADCISIADSSNDESVDSHIKVESGFKEPDYKTIKNIISVCHKKYVNKVLNQEKDSKKKKTSNIENLLKHKILSIGRKIINKQAFNCNGILRFMDHKNLDIDWKPIKQSQEKQYIRIMTQLRGVNKNVIDNQGWKKMNKITHEEIQDSIVITPDVNKNKTNNHCETNDISRAVLYIGVDNEAKKKILNQNPVDNPKQLPKKIVESKGEKNEQNLIELSVYDPNYSIATLQPKNTEETRLPIITSTTSLVEITVEGNSENDNQSDTSTGTAVVQPRIKVKPVSELMAPTPPCDNTNSNYNNTLHIPFRVIGTVPQYVIQIHNKPIQQERAFPSQVNNDDNNMIMLHTVELPHCKTESPFRYFQNLLQLHSIVLLDCNATLSSEFLCLVKFKVHYAEAAIDRPIVLCSSLWYLRNNFCIKILDSNHLDINLTKLSANWQWEILKTFVSDVANKMLENAIKLSRDVHAKASDFLRLLKSIETKKLTS